MHTINFQKPGDFFDDSWLKFLHNLNESLSNKSINVLYDYWLNEVDTKSQYDFIKRNHKMILNEFLKISNPELFECTLPECTGLEYNENNKEIYIYILRSDLPKRIMKL